MRHDHWLRSPPQARRRKEPFLWLLCMLLVIYAVMGRSGAYIGVPLGGGNKIFIGELVLLFGLASVLLEGGYERFFALPVAWVWLVFCAWNAAQTFPYISEYGLTALRDGATWGYSLFAVVVGSQLVARPSGFVILLNRYRRFTRVYVYFALMLVPPAILFPNNELGFEPMRAGDALEHVVGNIGIVSAGLVAVPAVWWWFAAVDAIVIGCLGRTGLAAFVAAFTVLWLNPWGLRLSVRAVPLFGVLAAVLAVMFIWDLNLGADARSRAISPRQLVLNVVGSFGETGEGLDGTREARLAMWDTIMDYTLFGSYFWTGKGYGINVAEDAGMPIDPKATTPARHPENSHLTFLARSGVPGFVLWVALQLTWAVGIVRVLLFSRRTRRRRTTGLMAFFLAYWTTLMVSAAFGALIETPYLGIWFWTIFGIGAAAAHVVRRDADFFERMELPAAVPASRHAAALTRPSPRPA